MARPIRSRPDFRFWHKSEVPTASRNVWCWGAKRTSVREQEWRPAGRGDEAAKFAIPEKRAAGPLSANSITIFLRQFGMPRLKYPRLAHSGSHGFLTCFPLGCLVVSNRFTACCVNRIERDSRIIAALSVASS